MTDTNNTDGAALFPCLVEGCSSKPRVQWQEAVAYVECAICGDTGPLGWTEDEAVAGWNARHRISHSLPGDVGMRAAVEHLLEVGEFCRTDDTESALRAVRAALATEPCSTPAPVGMREAVIDVVAHLAAAISLLKAGGKAAKKGAPSDKMFDQMIRDYERSLNRARAALTPSALSGDAGETLESIIAWGDQTFGPCSQERAIERAWEEWQEMLEKGADVPIEAADVTICLLRIPGILDAINRKMTINRGRTWDVRPDGTGYHVKAAALQHKGEVSRG